jgi:hypothetical protein
MRPYLKKKPRLQTLSSNPTIQKKEKKKTTSGQAWWYTSIIPALGRLRQEDRVQGNPVSENHRLA